MDLLGTARSSMRGRGAGSFSWTDDPREGESLMGFVTRIMASNGYPDVAGTLRRAGVRTNYPESIRRGDAETIARLSRLLLVPPDAISALAHPPVRTDAGLPERVQFFGSSFRRDQLVAKTRRVSPRTLMAEPWHHAVWDVRMFNFCPISMERLVEHCPVCGRELNWKRALGPWVCQYCLDDRGRPRVDLRDFPQETIAVEDPDALALAVGLVHCVGEERRAALRRLPHAFAGCGPGELFDLIVALVCCRLPVPSAGTCSYRRFSAEDRFRVVSADHVAGAARILMDWPEGLHRFADDMRVRRGERKGSYGKTKELGPLAVLEGRRSDLSERLRNILSSALKRDMAREEPAVVSVRRAENRTDPDLVPIVEAGREFGISPRSLWKFSRAGFLTRMTSSAAKGPVLLRRSEIAGLMKMGGDHLASHEVARRLGLTSREVAALADEGILRRPDARASLVLGHGEHYARRSLDRLVEGLHGAASPLPAIRSGRPWIRLSVAARRIPGDIVPWGKIFHAAACGTLEVRRASGSAGSVTASLLVRSVDDLTAAVPWLPCWLPDDERISAAEATMFLGTATDTIKECRARGLLGSGRGRPLTAGDARVFRRSYILPAEIAERLDVPSGTVRSRLAEASVEPVATFRRVGRRVDTSVYSRGAVERCLARTTIATAGRP